MTAALRCAEGGVDHKLLGAVLTSRYKGFLCFLRNELIRVTSVFDEDWDEDTDVDVHTFLQICKENLYGFKSVSRDLGSQAGAELDQFQHDPVLILVTLAEQ